LVVTEVWVVVVEEICDLKVVVYNHLEIEVVVGAVEVNVHMEKMNLEVLVEVGSNDEVVVMEEICDLKVVVSNYLEIEVVVVGV
jgi:hypothetical protein